MLFILFKLQSNHCPLVDSNITILKDTVPVRIPIPDEKKVITQYHHVSSYELWSSSQRELITCCYLEPCASTEPIFLITGRHDVNSCCVHCCRYSFTVLSLLRHVVRTSRLYSLIRTKMVGVKPPSDHGPNHTARSWSNQKKEVLVLIKLNRSSVYF